MARANRNGGHDRRQDDDPDETTVRTPAVKKVVDKWFPDQESDTDQDGGGR